MFYLYNIINMKSVVLQYHFAITVLVVLGMTAMSLHVFFNTAFDKIQKRWFLSTFLLLSIASTAELTRDILTYYPKNPLFFKITTLIEFSIAPFIPILIIGDCGLRKTAKRMFIPLILHSIFEIAVCPFDKVFSISETGKYKHEELYIVYIAVYMIGIIYAFSRMYFVSRNFKNRDKWTIISIIILLTVGISIQTFINSNIKTDFITTAIGVAIAYTYYDDLIQQDILEDIKKKNEKISNIQNQMVSGLAEVIDSRDGNTGQHVKRTSEYVKILAKRAQSQGYEKDILTDSYIDMLYRCAPLHDIGKISIKDDILNKIGPLTPDEKAAIEKHTTEGTKLIKAILTGIADEEYLSIAQCITEYHHEKWDGTGYPHNISGKSIPLCARLLSIADVYDALTSVRSYKQAYSNDQAFALINEGAGTFFDPTLVRYFLEVREQIIIEQHALQTESSNANFKGFDILFQASQGA